MQKKSHWIVGALLIAFASGGLSAAAAQVGPRAEPLVSAGLRENVVKLGASTTLTLTVRTARPVELVPAPAVAGLEWIGPSGPSVTTHASIVQNRISESTEKTWRWQLRPTTEGEFEIPPLAVVIDGRRHETESLRLVVVEDLAGQSQGFLELSGPTTRIVEGQPFGVELRFGWDAALTRVNHASLSLPWWDNLPGVLQVVLPPARDAGGVVVNGRNEVRVERLDGVVRDGRPFTAYRVRLELVATRPGEVEIAGSFLEYAELQSDFFGARRRGAGAFARAEDLRVAIEPLPTEGQPFDYGGAIGRISARASVDTRDVRVGESLKFTVEWLGDGNLMDFQPPEPGRLEAFEGLRSFAVVEVDKLPNRRRVVYDLAPLSEDITRIPPLPLHVFDPETWEYTTVETAPIPIRVRPLEAGLPDDAPARRSREQVHGVRHAPFEGSDAGGEHAPGDDGLAAVAAGIALSWLALRTAARRGGVDPGARPERRRRRALDRFSRALATSTDPEGDLTAWVEFVAARLGEDPEAWIGRDVRAWSEEDPRGRALSPYVVEELVQTARALEAAAYGGGDRVPRGRLLERARGVLEEGL